MRNFMAALTVLLASSASAASSATIIAQNQNEVLAAFKKAVAGDTVKLKGTFGLTYLKHYSWSAPVTLDATEATFTDTLAIADLKNLKVVGGTFKLGLSGTAYGTAIYVNTAQNVSIIDPTVAGGYISGAVSVMNSSEVSVTGGNFDKVRKGVGFATVSNGLIDSNNVTGATGDGFQVADSHNVRVTSNQCTGGTPLAGVHPDCVQMWSVAGNAPTSDILVSNNYASGYTQGFTEFNHDQGGLLRATITNNTVAGFFPQGIACYDCVDSLIAGNTLTSLLGAAHVVNLNVIGGRNNTVTNNRIVGFDRTKAMTTRFWTLSELSNGQLAASSIAAAVPEPTTWSTLVAGLGLIGISTRRKRYSTITLA